MKSTLILPAFTVITLFGLVGTNSSAQTYTAIMSGENSEAFHFINGNACPSDCARSTVTSIQSPFGYPGSYLGANDTQTLPTGNSSATPPYWFYYTVSGSTYTAHDSTGGAIYRNASYGQTSSQKASVIGIRPEATFSGTVSGSAGTMYETIYFSERSDWAGQREFGFVRQMSPGASYDEISFYWSTNSNCGVVGYPPSADNNWGYPLCRTSQAPMPPATEDPTTAPLVAEYFFPTQITGLTTGTAYYYNCYLFWATWDSTYKFRVEVWDSTYSTEITAFNVDTSSGGVNYGATTSGMNGYVTLGTQRADASNALSSSGVQLGVTSVQMAQ